MALQESFERLQCDLTVEQEVFVVQDQEEGSGARTEVLQVTAFDAEGAVTPSVRYAEGMVVDLTMLVSNSTLSLEQQSQAAASRRPSKKLGGRP
jgi:hypothetical protein